MSVARCQREVDSAEFAEWLGYSLIEPFGPQMDDLRTGITAAAIYNVNRDVKKRPEPFVPRDVVPWIGGVSGPAEAEPILLDDPDAQSALICAMLFGDEPRGESV